MVIVNFIKKYWLFIVLAAIATALVVLWYLKPVEKEEVVIKEFLPKLDRVVLPGESVNPNTRIVFAAQTTETKAYVLSLAKKPPLVSSEITRVAQTLGFIGNPIVQETIDGPMYAWNQGEYFLTISSNTHEIKLGRDLELAPPPQVGQLPNLDIAQSRLTSLIKELGFFVLKNTQEKSRLISLSGAVPIETDPNQAVFLEMGLSMAFDGKNIIFNNPKLLFTYIWIDKENKIAKFEWYNPMTSLSYFKEYPLKDQKEIVKSVYTEGKIALVEDRRSGGFGEKNISSVEISEIKLAYLLPQEGNLVQTIFILKGIAQDSSGQSFITWIYLPAIKEDYLK